MTFPNCPKKFFAQLVADYCDFFDLPDCLICDVTGRLVLKYHSCFSYAHTCFIFLGHEPELLAIHCSGNDYRRQLFDFSLRRIFSSREILENFCYHKHAVLTFFIDISLSPFVALNIASQISEIV